MTEQSETGLATIDSIRDLLANAPKPKFNDETAIASLKQGGFLPYIQLVNAMSEQAQSGKIQAGRFCLMLSKDNVVDLGTQFVGLYVSVRPKAMQFKPEVKSCYNPRDPLFQELKVKAEQGGNNCAWGPEFLVWLPEVEKFASYFLGNASGRNEGGNLVGPLQQQGFFAASQIATTMKNGKGRWFGPRTEPYTLPLANVPTPEILKSELEKFASPPDSEKEPVTGGETSGGSSGR